MNVTESIVRTIEKDGITLKDRQDVYNNLDRAILDGRFEFIHNGQSNIGFFSWDFISPTEVFINNLFIERKYRGTFNLRHGIRYLKAQYKTFGAMSWKNRKRNKIKRITI